MMNVLGLLPYAALFLVVLGFAFGTAHRWLEFGVGVRRPAADALALVVGAVAGAFVCWLTWSDPGTISECIDFTPDPSGRC